METNGAVRVVVGDDDRDRKAILNSSRELVTGHEEPTVAHQRDRAPTEAPRRGHRAGYAEAHGSRDRAQQTMRRLEWKVAPEPAGEISGIVHEHGVIAEPSAQGLDHRAEHNAIRGLFGLPASHACGHAMEPLGPAREASWFRCRTFRESAQKRQRVHQHRKIGREYRAQHIRIVVDVDQPLLRPGCRREHVALRRDVAKPGPHREHEIALLIERHLVLR